jgi:precorrin-6A synthase
MDGQEAEHRIDSSAGARRVLVVGVGSGDPDHLTVGAVRALNAADAVFLLEKGDGDPLAVHRMRLLAAALEPGRHPRVVSRAVEPVRGRSSSGRADYEAERREWRAARIAIHRDLVAELEPGETGAFLVWGDPSLFDGTLAVLDEVAAADDGLAVTIEVLPGVTSVAALAARHGVALHDVGEPVVLTTGRRVREEGWPAGAASVFVMVDSGDTLAGLDDDLRIWWGAFVGLPGECLIQGRLGDCRAAIERARSERRAGEGWMFDAYLLRR